MSQRDGILSEEGRQLAAEHLDLVRILARRMMRRLPAHVQFDELVSVGSLGLADAASRFDAARGVKFAPFAEHRIRGAMLDHLRAADTLSRDGRRNARRLSDAAHRLEGRLGRAASADEIADEMGVTTDDIHTQRGAQASAGFVSIDAAPGLLDHVAGAGTPDVFDLVAEREEVVLLAATIERLPERERVALGLYYHEQLTMKEIGDVMGVTESRVCQIHRQAIERLRGWLRPEMDDATQPEARVA